VAIDMKIIFLHAFAILKILMAKAGMLIPAIPALKSKQFSKGSYLQNSFCYKSTIKESNPCIATPFRAWTTICKKGL
jgi:hypothetical protein